jgi:hypothetical protein
LNGVAGGGDFRAVLAGGSAVHEVEHIMAQEEEEPVVRIGAAVEILESGHSSDRDGLGRADGWVQYLGQLVYLGLQRGDPIRR